MQGPHEDKLGVIEHLLCLFCKSRKHTTEIQESAQSAPQSRDARECAERPSVWEIVVGQAILNAACVGVLYTSGLARADLDVQAPLRGVVDLHRLHLAAQQRLHEVEHGEHLPHLILLQEQAINLLLGDHLRVSHQGLHASSSRSSQLLCFGLGLNRNFGLCFGLRSQGSLPILHPMVKQVLWEQVV